VSTITGPDGAFLLSFAPKEQRDLLVVVPRLVVGAKLLAAKFFASPDFPAGG
jgi:hypothetical protein